MGEQRWLNIVGCAFESRRSLSVYLIINGSLGMSAGKIAAQSFQAAQRLFAAAESNDELAVLLEAWQSAGNWGLAEPRSRC